MIPVETLETSLPALAPESRLVALAAPDSSAAEQYRVLLQRLDRVSAKRPLRVVAVTSATRGEGRTITAANLALTAAQEGRATILVETDVRNPAFAKLFGLAPRAGLSEVLLGTAELGQAVVRVGPLAVLCAGETDDPAATVRSPRIPAVMEALRAAYQHVILDAPPALAFVDGDRLAAAADGAVLVVRAGRTPRAVAKLAVETLGEQIAGIVVNGVDAAGMGYGRWLYADAPAPTSTFAGDGRQAG